MKPPKGQPCAGCPFRRVAAAGWLGSASPRQFIETALACQEPMPCHLEVNYDRKNWRSQLRKVHQCSGHAIFLANTGKLPRTDEVKRLPANHELVFDNLIEFLAHHEGDI